MSVPVDELLTSWLASLLPDVRVTSERPADLETRLPCVVVRRGGGGDAGQWVDGPIVDVDCYAAPSAAAASSAAATLAGQVDRLFRERTPAAWRGAQFTFLRCNQAPIKVSDSNPAVRHYVSAYSLSLQQ